MLAFLSVPDGLDILKRKLFLNSNGEEERLRSKQREQPVGEQVLESTPRHACCIAGDGEILAATAPAPGRKGMRDLKEGIGMQLWCTLFSFSQATILASSMASRFM